MATEKDIAQLLAELEDAKDWPARLRENEDGAPDGAQQINEAEKRIETLERRAKEAMKRLGCVNAETRTLYRRMADMLISWQDFKESLK